MKIGYARVSTPQQNIDRQIAALEAEGCDFIYAEKASGKDMLKRPQLKKAITALNSDDIFIVAEWDRATRSFEDSAKILAEIGERDAKLKVLDKPHFELHTPMGKAMLGILSAIAQDERERRLTQARDGRKHAKARGVSLGRKHKLTEKQRQQVKDLRAEGKVPTELASIFGVSKATIFRILQQ